MMIKALLLILLIGISFCSYTQNNVGIGTLTPNPNAALEIQSIDKGLLIPRITTAQRGIFGAGLTNTENSMLVYDVNDSIFYYWKATVWIPIPGINSDNQNIDSVILNPNDSILTVYIEDGLSASVDLKSAFDNTDEQTLSIIGDSLEISNGNRILFIDNDTTNEKIDSVKYENDTLVVYEGNNIYKTEMIAGTDEQTLAIIGDSLEISNGNRVLFIDNDTTNEKIDSVTYQDDTLTVYEGNNTYKAEIIGGEWSDADKIGQTNFIYAKQALNNGANDTVVITDDGSLGVGLANPNEKIQVDGSIRVGRISDGGAIQPPGPGDALYFSGGPDVSGIFDTDNSDWIGMGRFNLSSDVSELRIRLGDNQGSINNDAFVLGSALIGFHPWNEYFRVQSNGYVHIGTSALPAYPTNQLHLQGEINPIRVEGIQPGASTDSILTIDATGVIRKIPNSVQGEWNDADSIGMNGFIYAKQALNNGTNDTVVISDNGNIGVGTSSPTHKINVVDGNIRVDRETFSVIEALSYNDIGGTGGHFIGLRAGGTRLAPTQPLQDLTLASFHGRNALSPGIGGGFNVKTDENHAPGSQGSYLEFFTTPNGSSLTSTRMVIKNNGKVGVGTTNPTARLTLNEDNVTMFMAATTGGGGKQGISSDGDLFLGGESDTYIVSDMNAGAALGDIIFGDRVLGYNTNDAGAWVLDDEHMRIDGVTGNVGIGTNNPNGKLSIYEQTSVAGASLVALNEPHIVFNDALGGGDQSYVTGFGNGLLLGGNPTNYFNSVTGAIEPRADLFIHDLGRVGIGTINPTQQLEVFNGVSTGTYTATGWVHASDKRLKTNVQPVINALDIVKKLEGVYYNWKAAENTDRQIGFLAQDVQKILPEVVVGVEGDMTKGETLGMAYQNIVPVLVEALKEQQKEIEDLKNNENKEIKKLKLELEEIKKLLLSK